MKKALCILLCLSMVVTTMTNSLVFAKGINNNGLDYDPESLMDMLPQTGTDSSIPDLQKALTPQLPSVPDVSNTQALAEPANKEIDPPTVQNEEECPVDTATGKLILDIRI